jgi:non-specific serine/threonine protein kinase
VADLVDEYADGVWLAELASVADEALVPRIVAAALHVDEAPGQQLTDTLAAALPAKQLLLILDNCEHLVGACCQLVDRLLRSCPQVRMLATSRQPLGVPGELAWRVPSLTIPDQAAISGTDEIAACEAVRLFVDRARLAVPTFVVDDRNVAAVAQICRRLDGIPLAIELAAARLPVLALAQVVVRLDDRFRLLIGGSRTAPSRQQTLRATLDWSYGLLSELERSLFRRLSVFTGGFTLEGAEAVGHDEGADAADVLEILAALVDKSLVVAEPDADASVRYRLLETVRQYGQERLTETSARDTLAHRHAMYFLALAERAERELVGSTHQTVWLDRLEREHGNFRAALQWAIDCGDSDSAGRLAGALYRLWYLRGHLREGRRWFDQILSLGNLPTPRVSARVLRGAGLLAYAEGDYVAARTFTEQGLAVARELQDRELVSAALNNLGIILIDEGDYAAAQSRCTEGLALARELADEPFTAILLNNLGLVALYQADYLSAVPLLEESLAIAQRRGMLWSMAWSAGNLGNAAFHQTDLTTARSRFRQSLMLGQQVGDKRVIAERLEELGWVACAEAQARSAVRLFGAAEVLRETIGAPMPPANRAAYDRSVATARSFLGGQALADEWQQGRTLPLDEAIAEALALDALSQSAPDVAEPPGRLTARERQVASLVARGLSNREIGETLVVSVRTAESHITHLLNKLGLRSRAQLAVWAVEHGLSERPSA